MISQMKLTNELSILIFTIITSQGINQTSMPLAAMKYHLKQNSWIEAFRGCLLVKNSQTDKRKVSLTLPTVQLDLSWRVTPAYPGTEFGLPCFKWKQDKMWNSSVYHTVMTLHILSWLINFKSMCLRQSD